MSVVNIQRINIYALRKDRKKILEELQRKGVVQVEDISIDDSCFTKEETSQKQSLFLKNSALADNACAILNKYAPKNSSMLSMLEGRKAISVENYYMYVEDANEIMRIAYDIVSSEKEISDRKSEIVQCISQIESLQPWKTFDISLNFTGTSSTTAYIGVIPEPVSYEYIMTRMGEYCESIDEIELEIVSTTASQTCIFLVCNKLISGSVSDGLRHLGFSRPPVIPKSTPAETINNLLKDIEQHKKEVENQKNIILSYIGTRNALMFISDYYVMRADKYSVIERLAHTKSTFILKGYIPESSAQQLKKEFTEKYDAEVELITPEDDEEIPILLKNNGFVAPAEVVLETYSMPKKNEVDPTFIMAIFYYIFFGMMFSDAGYGIVMTGACAFALTKYKNMEDSLKKSLKMFMYCGISTIFWGFMYGSFFGDAVTVIGKTFFNVDIAFPILWINPAQGANSMRVLVFCFLFGIIHLFVGLGLKAYMCIKAKKYLDAVYDVLSWYLLVGGLILALLSTNILESMTGFILPSVFLTVGGIMAFIGALIILFFAGRGSNPVKRALKGVYGIYGITSYLSDILSYSRLLALGLATGVIAQVFNQIGAMFGGGIGVIPFAVIFIVGHTLNIGINALGAYVHTNRLQFVELFGKFYEGGGSKFSPFRINTKNYKIKEEIFNG